MDRPPHDYPAAMAFAQQQQQASNMPGQQQFGFQPQHQQFPPSVHGPPFLPPHPSVPQYPFPRQQLPQPLHPHLPNSHILHHQQQQPGPPFPPHMPPHLGPPPFPGGPYDSPPPPLPPPHDSELQKRIDKLVEYVAKNGPEFEAMVCEKEHGNPAYSFLFGGDGHGYYRYKLYLFARSPGPFGVPFPSSMPVLHPPPMNPAGVSGPMMGPPQLHQPPFQQFFDQQQPRAQSCMGHGRPDFDRPPNVFRGLAGPLPSDVAMELNNVLVSLTGTKESIKGTKGWFMQRSAFAPALAEALRDRVFVLEDSEKLLHIVYLANDILFDSFQRRVNPRELDSEALAFKPVLGSILARIYHHPQNKDENQSRLQKIVQFWATKEVFDQETIHALEGEMLSGPPAKSFLTPPRELSGSSAVLSNSGGVPHPNLPQWQPDKQNSLLNQEQSDRHGPSVSAMVPGQQFLPHTAVSPVGIPGSLPLSSTPPPANQLPIPHALPQPANVGEKLAPYPLFPSGLIPGMVKKQQIGSGVPYSPMSPLDIPTVIPPSDIPDSDILERVSKFFKAIGEVNPCEGPMSGSEGRYEDDYERQSPVRTEGACIPPPPNLQTDPVTETASFSSGRLGLGATAKPNEGSQYDDVYGSYRKERSSTYHTWMSARAVTRTPVSNALEQKISEFSEMEILRMDFVMAEILPKLPVKSLMRFKCVCKAFNDLITSPEFIQRQLCQSQSSDTNRLLVVPGGGRCVQVFDLDSPESPVTSFIWCENSFISVVGSCNGLLCVIRRDRGYTNPILLNPSTQKLLALNFSGLRQYIGCCVNYGFGFDDTNKDYKIVVVLEGYDNIVRKRDVSVYSLKTNSWRMVDRSSPQDSMEQRFGGVLINNHLLHWKFWCPSKSKRRIGCFDIQSELWKDDVLLPEYYYHPAEKNFLLDFGALDGCLYSSFENRQNSTFDIWVMKEYGAQDSWMKLLTIPTSDDLQGGIVPIVSRLGSGYDVLVRQRHQFKLFWCNKKNNAIIRAKFRGISEFSNLQAYICKGSLVSIPGSTQYIAAQPEEDRM